MECKEKNSMLKKFSLGSKEGSKRVLSLLVVLCLLFSLFAALISSNGGKIKIEKNIIDVRGASLEGELYYPAGVTDEDQYPAVVVVEGAGCTNYNLRSFAEEIAKRGYVVLNLNAYGSGESETPVYNENDQGINEYNIFGTPMGVLDAVDYLRSVKYIDSTNIGIIGHSQGSRRAGYAALMDCGYYSFNDIMLNVLHDNFNLILTESDLKLDADKLAKEKLNADQLANYQNLKDKYQEDYDSMIKSICLVGSTAQFVNPIQTVQVAGIDVQRTCKVNMAVINGAFDFGNIAFSSDSKTKEAWYLPDSENITSGSYYALDDVNGTSEMVGNFRKDSVESDEDLRKAIENRCLRTAIITKESHSKEMVSGQATTAVIDFFNQTLNHNTNVLSTSKSDTAFMWREFFNFLAMMCMLLMLFPILSLKTAKESYSGCITEGETIIPEKNRKIGTIIVIIGTLVLNMLALYLTNAGKNYVKFAKLSKSLFPLMITAWTPFNVNVWIILAAIIITVAYLICTNGFASFKDFLHRNFTIGIKNVFKCLGIAVTFILCGYILLSVVQYLFTQDFRMWMVSFGVMKNEHWFMAVMYFILALPFYIVSNIATNYLSDVTMGKKSKAMDITLTVIMNCITIWLLCAYTNFLSYSGLLVGKAFNSFQLTYGIIVLLPIMLLISRKCYLKTKNIWVGSFANSLLLAWMLVSVSGTNAFYVAQNWIGNFLGF